MMKSVDIALKREARLERCMQMNTWRNMFRINTEESKVLWARFFCDSCGRGRPCFQRLWLREVDVAEAKGEARCS